MNNPVTYSLDHWTTLFLLAVGQGVFLAVILLFNKSENRTSNRILGCLLLVFSITLFEYVLHWSKYIYFLPRIRGLYISLAFIIGPLIWLYFKSIKSKDPFNRTNYLHFLPAALFFINRLPVNLSPINALQGLLTGDMEALRGLGRPFIVFYPYMGWLIVIHLTIYVVVSWLYLKKLKVWGKDEFLIQITPIEKRWFRVIFFLYTGFVIANVSYYLLNGLGWLSQESDYAISMAMAIFIYTVGFLGYKQPAIFSGQALQTIFTPKKYQNSSLTPSAAASIEQQLVSYFKEEKPYLDNDLRQSTLADQLGISVHHLSQVINQQLGKSFAEFLNEYRVKAAIDMLVDPKFQDQLVMDIAYQSGFNNKTSFNKAFRAYTGMSPSQYRKKKKEDVKPGPSF